MSLYYGKKLIADVDQGTLTILTDAPTSDNLSGNYKIVHLTYEPEHKYKGYIYCISEED